MTILITAILDAGRSAVDIAIFTFLPLMIVTFSLMRYLESRSTLRLLAAKANPIFRVFGLDGLGVLAVVQLSFVSSAAPIAALSLMVHKKIPDKLIAAAFAAVLAAAPANASLPLATIGIDSAWIISNGICGALVASTLACWTVGLRSSSPESICSDDEAGRHGTGRLDLLAAINRGGTDAIRVIAAILPALVISLALIKLISKYRSTFSVHFHSSTIAPTARHFPTRCSTLPHKVPGGIERSSGAAIRYPRRAPDSKRANHS